MDNPAPTNPYFLGATHNIIPESEPEPPVVERTVEAEEQKGPLIPEQKHHEPVEVKPIETLQGLPDTYENDISTQRLKEHLVNATSERDAAVNRLHDVGPGADSTTQEADGTEKEFIMEIWEADAQPD